jgi:predicted transcriptional regulator
MPDELKKALQEKAAAEDSDMTKVIVRLIEDYVHDTSADN